MAFSIMVRGIAAPQHIATVRQALMTLAQASRRQPGTLRYEFYQPDGEAATFILLAMWEDEAGWQANVKSPEHDDYVKSLPEDAWAQRPAVTILRPVPE